jgi:hypothetical protein
MVTSPRALPESYMSLNKDSLGKWLLFFTILTIASVQTQPVEASIPSGYQSFYVLGDSTKIILEAVDPAVGLPISGANPYSVFSVAPTPCSGWIREA